MANKSSNPLPTEPGLHQLTFQRQRYSLSIPINFRFSSPAPLILALHYAGHGTPYYGTAMITELVGPAFGELKAIIVAPDCTATDWSQPKSVTDTLALLDYLDGAYSFDPQRKLVTGYSMGGMGTWYFAANHPKYFSTAIIMAGLPLEYTLEVDWQIPLFLLHSHQDELMPIEPSMTLYKQLRQKGVDIQMRELYGITHFEVHRFVSPLRETIPWLLSHWEPTQPNH